jgi:hypothetical protein
VQKHIADPTADESVLARLHQQLRDTLPAMTRINEDVKHAAAPLILRVSWMGWPIDLHQTNPANSRTSVLRNAAQITPVRKPGLKPAPEWLGRLLKIRRRPARLTKHIFAVAVNEVKVGSDNRAKTDDGDD